MFTTHFFPYPVSASYSSYFQAGESRGCCGARVAAFRSCCGQNIF